MVVNGPRLFKSVVSFKILFYNDNTKSFEFVIFVVVYIQ